MSVTNPQQQQPLYQYHSHQHPQQQQQQHQQQQPQQLTVQQQHQQQLQQQLQQQQIEQELAMEEDLKRRLEKLARNYDMETMKVFMVVEAVGERSLHAVYNPQAKVKVRWQSFLQRLEACRLDLVKHEKTRERYKQFLREVGREDQGRQWFLAVLRLLRRLGAADVFDYVNNHTSVSSHSRSHHHHHQHSCHHHHQFSNSSSNNNNKKAVVPYRSDPRRHSYDSKESYRRQLAALIPPDQEFSHPHHSHALYNKGQHSYRAGKVTMERELTAETAAAIGVQNGGFCDLMAWLFEKKIESWFDSFQAVAVNLTAHVKVSGLVRVLSGKVHALCTRQGRLHAVTVKVTGQDTPRPLDVAELCLAKVMIIQNGLALPEDLGLAMLVLHTNPARPVLRLWQLTPSAEMETAIRLADIDEMIDGGRMSQYHELWTDNTITDLSTTATTATDPTTLGVDAVGPGPGPGPAKNVAGAPPPPPAAAASNGGADYNVPDKNHLAFMAAKSSVAAQPTMPTIGENPSVVDDGGSPLNF